MTDPIADFLTRIRNAVKANHKVVEAPGLHFGLQVRQRREGPPHNQDRFEVGCSNKDQRYQELEACEPSRFASVRIGRLYASRIEWLGYRNPFNFEGYHDRC